MTGYFPEMEMPSLDVRTGMHQAEGPNGERLELPSLEDGPGDPTAPTPDPEVMALLQAERAAEQSAAQAAPKPFSWGQGAPAGAPGYANVRAPGTPAPAPEGPVNPYPPTLGERGMGMPLPGINAPLQNPGVPTEREGAIGEAEQTANVMADAAVQVSTQAERDANELAGEEAARRLEMDNAAVTEIERIRFEGQRKIDEHMRHVQEMAHRLANSPVDPNRAFKNMSVFEGIATTIALGLGGALSVNSGGQNPVVAVIEKKIERDLAAQEQDRANWGKAGQLSDSLLAQSRSLVGDQLSQAEFARAAMLRASIAQLDQQMAGVNDQRILANGMQIRAQLEDRLAQQLVALQGREREWATVQAKLAMTAMKAGGGGPGKPKEPKPRESPAGAVPGIMILTRDEQGNQVAIPAMLEDNESSRVFRRKVASAQRIADSVDTIISLGLDRNAVTDATKIEAQQRALDILIGQLERQKGAASEHDAKRFEDMMGGMSNPQKFWSVLNAKERARILNNLVEITEDDVNATAESEILLNEGETLQAWRAKRGRSRSGPPPATARNDRDRRATYQDTATETTDEMSPKDPEASRGVTSEAIAEARQMLQTDDPKSLKENIAAVRTKTERLLGQIPFAETQAARKDILDNIRVLEDIKRDMQQKLLDLETGKVTTGAKKLRDRVTNEAQRKRESRGGSFDRR